MGVVYPCFCSRKDVRESLDRASSAPHSQPPIYSGRCRAGALGADSLEGELPSIGWRFRSQSDPSGAQDFIIGRTIRADALESFEPAYHWACAIDDWDLNPGLLVRAWDLESARAPQEEIQSWVASTESKAFERIPVFHTALVTQNDGHRLEKRTRGVTLEELCRTGWDEDRLVQCLARSYPAGGVTPSGEGLRTLTVQELGLP